MLKRKRSEMGTIDDIEEDLKCPVCLDVPKNKVYQCRKGHTICDDCYPQITTCPQCRVPFDEVPIQSLLAEKMLDKLKFECPYQSSGCTQPVDRKSFADHVNCCSFNIAKFGPFVNVCQTLGFNNCTFQMNKGNVAESIEHFKLLHDAFVEDPDFSGFVWENYSERSGGSAGYAALNKKNDGYAFLIVGKLICGKNGYISLSAFYWQYEIGKGPEVPPPYQVEFNLKGNNYMTWSVSPIDIFQNESQSSELFSMRVPVSMFVDKYDVLEVWIKLVKSE